MKKLLKIISCVLVTTPLPLSLISCGEKNSSVSKTQLKTITTLSGLNLESYSSKKFSDLNAQIINANEFTNTPLATGYTIQYWDSNTGGNDITNQTQSNKKIWVIISASNNDPYWTGKTIRLSIIITAANFTNITGTNGQISALASDSSGTIYAGSTEGKNQGSIYKSDGTSPFTKLSGITDNVKQIAVSTNGTVYAITNTNVYKSDGTSAFTILAGVSDILTSMVIDKNGTVYVGTRISEGKGNVYKSDGISPFTKLSGITDNVTSLATDKNNILFVATSTKIYKQNLTKFDKLSGTNGRIWKIIINQTTGTIYAAANSNINDFIIYKSDGSNPFQQLFKSSGINGLSAIACNETTNTLYFSLVSLATSTTKLYSSTNNNNYTEIPGITSGIKSLTIGLNNSLYVGVYTINSYVDYTGTVYKKL